VGDRYRLPLVNVRTIEAGQARWRYPGHLELPLRHHRAHQRDCRCEAKSTYQSEARRHYLQEADAIRERGHVHASHVLRIGWPQKRTLADFPVDREHAAIADANEAIRLYRGRLIEKGKLDRAIRDLDEAVQMNPKLATVLRAQIQAPGLIWRRPYRRNSGSEAISNSSLRQNV
jgi:hypothetical protein